MLENKLAFLGSYLETWPHLIMKWASNTHFRPAMHVKNGFSHAIRQKIAHCNVCSVSWFLAMLAFVQNI